MQMHDLKVPTDPFEVDFDDLDVDLKIKVRPASSFDMAVANAEAQAVLDRLDEGQDVCIAAGLFEEGRRINLEDSAHRSAVFHIEKIKALARNHIVSWEGPVGNDGAPTPVTPAAVDALMMIPPIGEKFFEKITIWHRRMLAAKKGFGASANGTSSQAAAPHTAKDANAPEPTAPKAEKD